MTSIVNPPDWSERIRTLYLSGAANQFILHGNVDDRLMLPEESGEGATLGNLYDFLVDFQLRRFDVILTYDLGHGLQVRTNTKAGKKLVQAWPSARSSKSWPKAPRDGIAFMDHFLRFCCNLRQLKPSDADQSEEESSPDNLTGRNLNVALIVRTASLVMSARSMNTEVHSIASLVRSWSTETHFVEQNVASFLLTENFADLHPLVAGNPRAASLAVPLPDVAQLTAAIRLLGREYPEALGEFAGQEKKAANRLAGTTLSSVESLLKIRHHEKEPLDEAALANLKKELVERDCQGLIEFIEPDRTLNDIHGSEPIKEWMRQDIALWQKDDLKAMPMGYLLCGPVGTGKTYFVECLAGEAGVPVVKFRNFRDRWVGSTEGNLEKIFTFLHALGRCIVFIDEADQALGSRSGTTGDSGVSGRVYSMMAEEMSNTRNRGRILWILASSRPDLIEVDLKRPGRVDVKIPLFPTVNQDEAYGLIRALCWRQGLQLPEDGGSGWGELLPAHITPGAAEAIAIKVYRLVQTQDLAPLDALSELLSDYQSPVPQDVMDFQIGLAVREASDLSFVPEVFRE